MVGYAIQFRDLQLRVSGDGWGAPGIAEFLLPQLPPDESDSIVLPKMELAELAILVEAALDAPARSSSAFVSSALLASRLQGRGLVDIPNSHNAIRTVYRFRKRLRQAPPAIAQRLSWPAGSDPVDAFARTVIIRDKQLGYRINLHPDNLELDF